MQCRIIAGFPYLDISQFQTARRQHALLHSGWDGESHLEFLMFGWLWLLRAAVAADDAIYGLHRQLWGTHELQMSFVSDLSSSVFACRRRAVLSFPEP